MSSECKKASTTRPGKFYLDNSKTFTSCCIGQSIRNSSESENSGSNDKKNSCQEETSQVLSDGYKNFIYEPERNWSLQQEHVSKLEDEIEDLKRQEKMMMDEVHTETLYVQKPHDEYDVLKVQLDFAANQQQSIELHVQGLDANVRSRQQGVMELETKRNGAENAVNENWMKLEQSFYCEQPEVQEKLIQLKEIEQETEAALAEILKREAEHLDLLMEFEEQPKLPSRKSYIQRITEITKNSRKLDADIKQILMETRELQLENNSIQERLHRTHAVVDEAVFREAKKDAMGRQAYRLLSSIHDSFQQIADTILATDRAQREAAALEAKLAKLSSRGFDITRLQADLDSIRKENELLEQKCHNVLPIS